MTNQRLLPKEHIDGVSLKPILEGKTLPQRPLFWHYPHYGNQGGDPTSIIREGDWKLIYYWENDKTELYNLERDPTERTNLSLTNVKKTKKLNQKLHSWLTNVNANKPIKNPLYTEASTKKALNKIKNDLLPRLELKRKQMLSKDFKPNKDWWGSNTID